MARKKYATSLKEETIRKMKQLGLDFNMKDNEVIENAVTFYDIYRRLRNYKQPMTASELALLIQKQQQ